ncbi:uncharacterized protein LOC141686407 [Apium graveolens]|uniref:uncharacterized protein LOC141686407 n=1 Tax=Apium graveolens TaxID=4045 RepID=UPI003D7A3FC7
MNNEAEYKALIASLGLATVRSKNLKVCGKSRLVVAQVNGEFEDKDDTMAKYLRVVKGIPAQFDEWQAEVANRIILDGLKKKVERLRNTWAYELLPILWVYRTTSKVITKDTPFMLAYGAEAMVPLEITNGSLRIEAYEPETNEEGMRIDLDLIDEIRDEANARNAEHQQRASLYYNRRVKKRFFQQGDLVLRKIEASGVGERGKLAPNWEWPYKVRKTL